MAALQHVITKEVKSNPVVKKVHGPQVGHRKKRCEIQGGSQEMAAMVD